MIRFESVTKRYGDTVAVNELDFDGWIVVEQDVLNAPDVSITDFARQRAGDQQTNRAALKEWA